MLFMCCQKNSSLCFDALSPLLVKGYRFWDHSERGIWILGSLNSRCRHSDKTQGCTQHLFATVLYFVFFKFSSSILAWQPLNGGRPFFLSSSSGLYTLTGGKRHSGLNSISTMENSPEILLLDDVGPGVDAIGQGADTEEGRVCPFSELARGVWKQKRFRSTVWGLTKALLILVWYDESRARTWEWTRTSTWQNLPSWVQMSLQLNTGSIFNFFNKSLPETGKPPCATAHWFQETETLGMAFQCAGIKPSTTVHH